MAALAVSGGFVACGGSSSQGIRPTTGITLRAETLTTGRGCGTSPTEIFKYVVVVLGYRGGDAPPGDPASYDRPVTSNVFDCFADGTFVELPSMDDNATFRLEVYAYNEPTYTAARGAIAIALAGDTSTLRETEPTWTTVCSATQQPEVESLAVCAPLAPGLSGLGQDGGAPAPVTRIELETTSFRLPDGRVATCAPEPDGGLDAGGEDTGGEDAGIEDADAPDAPEAGEVDAEADAGSEAHFSTVRVRYRTEQSVGPTLDVACPTPYVAEVPAEPRRYELDVGLIGSNGDPLGTTVCSVTSAPGKTSPAACP